MNILIVSGISGSGKTTFLRALEDLGYFCVDNFPIILLRNFLEHYSSVESGKNDCAFVVDVREREFFEKGKEVLKEIKEKFGAKIIFLESTEHVLLRRYKETRRSHPLKDSSNIKDALKEEREIMSWLRDMADQVLDTSHMIPHELRRLVLKKYGGEEQRMKINLLSFGYAFGIPMEADMVLDARFLPNPFFVEGLRDKTGLSCEIGEYLESHEVFNKYFEFLSDFLLYLIPLFEHEGKTYLTVCFGCTGGKHRSVFITDQLAKKLTSLGYNVSTIHRDIDN
ncbi:MAG TPA: RNase adapter RapZ [Syntrophorhabdaceae bacterium]|nr:RNase adapter RapZ [Syntrophorhabdaceae bacterium]